MIGCTLRGERALERAKCSEEAVLLAQFSKKLSLPVEGKEKSCVLREGAERIERISLNAIEWRRQCQKKGPWDNRRGGSILEAPKAYKFIQQVAERMRLSELERATTYWEFIKRMHGAAKRIRCNQISRNPSRKTRELLEEIAEWCLHAAHVRALQVEHADRLLDNDD